MRLSPTKPTRRSAHHVPCGRRLHLTFGCGEAAVCEGDIEQALFLGVPGKDALVALVLPVAVAHKCLGAEDLLVQSPFIDAAGVQRLPVRPLAIHYPFTFERCQWR